MLMILYRDNYPVAVNKPPGLLLHRLDKGTSAVLLFALDAAPGIGWNPWDRSIDMNQISLETAA